MKTNRMMPKNQKILIGLYAVSISVAGIFLLQSILYLPNPLFIIISDSMVPTLQIGDVVMLEEVQPQEIGAGDIIAFGPPIKTVADILIHRVQAVDFSNDGTLTYTTKGDANLSQDPFTITHDDVLGRVLFKIPFLGQAFFLLSNPLILIIIVIFALRRFI